jgi:OPT oligopeptide transporter protein
MDRQRGETLEEALHTSRATGHEAAPHYSSRAADDHVSAFAQTGAWDPNMEDSKLKEVSVTEHDVERELKYEQDVGEDSPYPEVRAAVDNTDDMSVPANTLRAWFLGLIFVTIGSGLNVFFSLRDPNISIGPLVVQLCSYPVGKFMELVLPRRVFSLFGLKFSLNPGPFNKKEHTLITVMANVAFAAGQPGEFSCRD